MFYEFICVLENTFLANANIRMMIAYSSFNIFETMVSALYTHKDVVDLFKTKLGLEAFNQTVIDGLLDDILTRFLHIRGHWFIKKVQGQGKLSAPHTTRKNIQIKTEIAKATADVRRSQDKKYETYYKEVEENILTSSIELENI